MPLYVDIEMLVKLLQQPFAGLELASRLTEVYLIYALQPAMDDFEVVTLDYTLENGCLNERPMR